MDLRVENEEVWAVRKEASHTYIPTRASLRNREHLRRVTRGSSSSHLGQGTIGQRGEWLTESFIFRQ